MPNSPIDDVATVAQLKSKFGEDADLYAEVRAETAAIVGRTQEARKWKETAEQVKSDDAGPSHE